MNELRSKLVLLWNPSPTKNILIATTALIWLAVGVSFLLYGYEPTWRLWGIQTMSPFFIDFRLLPAMVRSLHMGLDPTVYNAADPQGRVFNYPSVWYLLAYTGISQSDALWAGVVMLCLFFFGLFLFPGPIRKTGLVFLLLAAFSPAAMLLYERANVDLLMFFLCAVAVALADFSAVSAALAVGLASVLKFFPFFGFAMFMSKGKRTFFSLLIISAVLFAAYLAFVSRDLGRAWDLTMRGNDNSYGVQVFAMHFPKPIKLALKQLSFQPGQIPSVANWVSYAVAALVGLLCLYFGVRQQPRWSASSSRNLDAFWLGSAIYIGTFLLGNNWDYRLAFLLFCVPQLSDWLGDTTRERRIGAGITLGLILLACWYLFYKHYVPASAQDAAFVLGDIAKWSLYGALTYLLIASTPQGIMPAFAVRRSESVAEA